MDLTTTELKKIHQTLRDSKVEEASSTELDKMRAIVSQFENLNYEEYR